MVGLPSTVRKKIMFNMQMILKDHTPLDFQLELTAPSYGMIRCNIAILGISALSQDGQHRGKETGERTTVVIQHQRKRSTKKTKAP